MKCGIINEINRDDRKNKTNEQMKKLSKNISYSACDDIFRCGGKDNYSICGGLKADSKVNIVLHPLNEKLFNAIKKNDIKLIKDCIKKGANINSCHNKNICYVENFLGYACRT